MRNFLFPKKSFLAAASLIKAKGVAQILFSEGTYQIEVIDPKSKKHLWPFIQMDDSGEIIDCFCTCQEEKKSCIHLAAAYLKIFNDKPYPLHVRFRGSLWNRLCQIASRRHGYASNSIWNKKSLHFETRSAAGKCLFSLKGLTAAGKKKIHSILFQRKPQTEETSLKFSNLSSEELLLWKEGRPSHFLQYELSFWSDLAKWWILLEEEEPYTISFEEEAGKLPHWIQIRFKSVSVGFYIAFVNWPRLIPSLSLVSSPLSVHELQQHKIKSIRYDPLERALLIKSQPLEEQMKSLLAEQGIAVAEWTYLPKKGFFPTESDPLFNEKVIPQEKIGAVLQKHTQLIQKYLIGTQIHLASVKANYHLFFDQAANLHIRWWVFKVGDMLQKNSAYFGPWVYLDGQGFYAIENLLFPGIEKIIPRTEMSDFINRHRAWLNGFTGYQTHVLTLESHLRYFVTEEGFLRFEATLDLSDIESECIDFGEWIYFKGKGFFAKKIGRTKTLINPETSVAPSEISAFIRKHREELEQIQDFFAKETPLEKSGVEIFLEEQEIVVRPHFSYYPSYHGKAVQIYGDFTFVPKEGFCEIPNEKRLPPAFLRERRILPEDESYFILYEMDLLKPFILSIQKELTKPKYSCVRILDMKKGAKEKVGEWILHAQLETDIGSVSLYRVWKALVENKPYLFSSAGLLLLYPQRFNWLKNVTKRRWLKEGDYLKISTMDWMRLSVLEELLLPEGHSKEEERTKAYIETIETFKTDESIDLTGFKSTLRAYQQVGVRWLYFLRCHGLSGLLCDEMGLGKTHQAMGLLAAAKNRKNSLEKYLVVCPTSVIYHWEELLKKFLPALRVTVFYGIGRRLKPLEEQTDLLLTSYGTLRSEKQLLAAMHFDVAVFDEIQIAKNSHSQTHKALRKIDATTRIGLTGTPIENRLLELKALFDVVLPGYMPQEAQFKEYFVNPIEKAADPERKVLLSRLTRPFILRRKKAEVLLELPNKIEEIAYCVLSDEQKKLYKQACQEVSLQTLKTKEGMPLPMTHIFSLFSTLKQVCDHPCLITKQYDSFQKHRSGKWDLFVELLQEIRDSGQKVVVFSQYLGMLDMFAAYLEQEQIGFATIRGSTRDRKEQLEKFRTDPQCEVFLASLQAAGVGIDLVCASVVIHYDRWWNPARENQATDRVHRIGQNRGVQVFKMVTKNTIEEHIHRLIEKKMGLLEEVIAFDDQDQIKGLNREEILQILRMLEEENL